MAAPVQCTPPGNLQYPSDCFIGSASQAMAEFQCKTCGVITYVSFWATQLLLLYGHNRNISDHLGSLEPEFAHAGGLFVFRGGLGVYC